MTPAELITLDALGEATPEQRARLVTALQADPALANEHAALCRVASELSSTSSPELPPMPHDLVVRLDSLHSAAARKVLLFPALRRFVPLAAAAAIAVLAGIAWLTWRAPGDSLPLLAQRTSSIAPNAASETLTLSAPPAPAAPAQPGTKRALIVLPSSRGLIAKRTPSAAPAGPTRSSPGKRSPTRGASRRKTSSSCTRMRRLRRASSRRSRNISSLRASRTTSS